MRVQAWVLVCGLELGSKGIGAKRLGCWVLHSLDRSRAKVKQIAYFIHVFIRQLQCATENV